MSEIALSRLDEIATFASGGTPAKASPEYWGGSIPWLTPKDMSDFRGVTQDCVTSAAIGNGTRVAPLGTIFVAVRGMSLHHEIRIVRPDRAMSFNQDIKAIIPKNIDSQFLYYALLNHKPLLLSIVESAGHGTGRLPTDRLSGLLVPQVSEEEQQAIASVLGALDCKIELNRRMNDTLEAISRTIFKDWFVDFGPSRAKMEGRAPYLSEEIWSLFPDRLDHGGKPEGWKQEPLGAHMSNFDSKRVPVSGGERAKRQGPFPYHGATGVMDHVDSYLFDGIFLLVGEDGSVVKENGLAFTQYVWGKIWVNNHAHVLQGKGSVSTEQLLLYFQHETVTPYITGAVQLKLSQGRMNAMPFIYAGPKICEAFTNAVAPLFAGFRANVDESTTLAKMRDLLLPKLMSGEIRVREVEKQVREVL